MKLGADRICQEQILLENHHLPSPAIFIYHAASVTWGPVLVLLGLSYPVCKRKGCMGWSLSPSSDGTWFSIFPRGTRKEGRTPPVPQALDQFSQPEELCDVGWGQNRGENLPHMGHRGPAAWACQLPDQVLALDEPTV